MRFSQLLILALFMLVFATKPASAQKNSLRGTILDADNRAIPSANVYLEGTVRGVMSDDTGKYTMRNIPQGEYTLKISYLGYKEKSIPFRIAAQENLELNVSMVEDRVSLDAFEYNVSRGITGQERLPEVGGFQINAAKKNEVIRLDGIDATWQ